MTAAAAGAPQRRASMLDWLAAHARRQPRREAAVEGSLRLDYAQLAQGVETAALALASRGLGPGRVLGYFGPPGVQYLVSLLAAFRCGATWLGLNPRYRAAELGHVLQDARPGLVLVAQPVDAPARRELGAAAALGDTPAAMLELGPGLDGLLAGLAAAPAPQALPPPSDELAGTAVLVYTSGTTGRPKGARLSPANLAENAWWLARRIGEGGGRFLINLPVNHVGCIADATLVALLLGDTLVFMPAFEPAQAAELIRTERITTVGQVPTQYQMMQAAGVLTPDHLASVRHLAWGGAPMPASLVETLGRIVPDLFNGYGLTESTGTVTVTPPGASVEQLAQSVGLPVADGVLRIVDGDGQLLPPGVDGEVQIRGAHVFAGYLHEPAASAAALTADGWLRSGDLGHWRPDGSLRLVGRLSEMYKSGGYNIYPREIEAVLEACPGVVMAAVIGRPDPLWGEAGCAFVLCEDDAVDAAALERWCRERLAAYKVPKRFELRAELPLLPIGKIDKRRLAGLIA